MKSHSSSVEAASCRLSTSSTPSTPSTTPEARALRRLIQAHRIKRLGWSDYVFHYVMSGLGFGTSLTALSYDQLSELWSALRTYRKSGLPYEFSYNRWGNYMFALQKQAGWDDATLRAYLLCTYKKSHWNLLTYKEKKELITLLQSLPSTVGANCGSPVSLEESSSAVSPEIPPLSLEGRGDGGEGEPLPTLEPLNP